MSLGDWGELPIGEALAERLSPALAPLGFRLAETAEDGVRYDGDATALVVRYVPRDGDLAMYVTRHGSAEQLWVLTYLRGIASPAWGRLGEAVADSRGAALAILDIVITAIPELTPLLRGSPVELERARSLRRWHVTT